MSDDLNIQRLARALRGPLQGWGFAIPEQGTFAPTYLGGTTPGVTTYAVQVGAWTRIGPRLLFDLTLQWTAATGTGTVRVGGLPYPSANVTNQNFTAAIYSTTVTFPNTGIDVLMGVNVQSLRFFSPATNAANAELVVEAAGLIICSGSYLIA